MIRGKKYQMGDGTRISKEGVSAIQVKSGRLDLVNIIYGWSDMGTHLKGATRKQVKRMVNSVYTFNIPGYLPQSPKKNLRISYWYLKLN